MPKDRNASEFFDRVFGVIADGQTKREPIKLKVCTSQANYIRDLKLQEAEERNEEYSIFSYYLRPTYDFQQELLWHGEDVVVLEPKWLREELAERLKCMYNRYENE